MLQLVLDAGTVSYHSIDTSPRHIVAIFVIIEGLTFWSFLYLIGLLNIWFAIL